MSETWAGNYFIRFIIHLNTYRIMSTSIQVIANEQPYRIIGSWSADNGYKGSINYGFETLDKAKDYMRTLESVARSAKMTIKSAAPCTLDVTAKAWCAMRNFKGSYRVAQYINN